MAKKPSYLRAAFLAPANLLALVTTASASAATGQTLPLLIAAGAEAVYLGVLSSIPSFRRAVRANANAVPSEPDDEILALLEELAPSQREHYFALKELRDKILGNYRRLPGGRVLAAASETRVDALLANFLRLLSTLNNYRKYLSSADRAQIEHEITSLERELAQEPNAKLREVKQKRVEILQKRVQRFIQAEESREVVSHQLAGIEDLLRLTLEQSIAIRDPDAVTRQLDALAAEVQATEATVREMEQFMAITEELSSHALPVGDGRIRT